ncbi:MAG: hypothetical protein K8H88_32660, partial [Sandaracinaceae bacterium]|nr:hypothetical protein [Sandaracinaceae bacterium]
LRASTCAAWLDFDTACASAADCGSGSGDLCQDADPGPSTVPHCTLPCATDNDCPATVACDRRLGFCLTQ